MSESKVNSAMPANCADVSASERVIAGAQERFEQIAADLVTVQADQAFQGQTVQALNDALALQQTDILEMQRQIALLAEQLRSLRESTGAGDAGGAEAVDAKPPHY